MNAFRTKKFSCLKKTYKSINIWYNCWISTPRNLFTRDRWRRWMESGIVTINDIVTPEQGRLMGQKEIDGRYGIKLNFMKNLSNSPLLRSSQESLGSNMKAWCKEKTWTFSTQPPKKWYGAILWTKKQEIKRKESWRQELVPLQEHPLQIDWEDTYTIPYSFTERQNYMHFSIAFTTGS